MRSAQGPIVVADHSYGDAPRIDVVLMPGGIGTRTLVQDRSFGAWLATWTPTGRAGHLSLYGVWGPRRGRLVGRLPRHVQQAGISPGAGPRVDWVARARWVQDRDRWTSAGVAAGVDMTLALIARLHSEQLAAAVADRVEYDWHRDATWDPFATKNGLVVD